MGVHSAISLADFGQELIRRTLVTFVRAAKLTFGAMLASAAVFSLISLFQRYPMATAKVMGLIFLSATVALLTRVHFGRLTGTVQGEQTLREAVNERYASDLNWESTPLKQREEINIRSLERLDPGYVKDAAVKGLWRHAESETLRNRYLLAQVLGKRGRNNEALEVLRGLLWRYKELGLSSPETISSRYLLAQILSKRRVGANGLLGSSPAAAVEASSFPAGHRGAIGHQ
jgi:hypothetical protein